MKFTLSQILKYSGIVIGALGALKIIFAEVEAEAAILSVHWISLIVLGIGALVYFIGVWEKKHESTVSDLTSSNQVTSNSVSVSLPSSPVVAS